MSTASPLSGAKPTAFIRKGNEALLEGNYSRAIRLFVHAMVHDERLVTMAEFNLELAADRLKDTLSVAQHSDLSHLHGDERETFNDPLLNKVIDNPCQRLSVNTTDAAAALYALIWKAAPITRDEALNILRGNLVAKDARPQATPVSLTDGVYERVLSSLKNSPKYDSLIATKLPENEEKIRQRLAAFSGKYKPLVSVIMPTYNRSEIILEAIASALQQSYEHFELLVCDDGSSDDTEQKVRGIDDKRVRYFKQANAGAAAARNLGLSKADGAVICYLDTDNYWHPDYLKLVVTTFQQNGGRSALYFDFIDYQVKANGNIDIRSTHRPAFNHEQLITKPFIDLNTFAHKRELYDAFGGFDPSLTRRQDYDVMLKYTWLRDPLHVPLFVALYQRNENLDQITRVRKGDDSCVPIINRKIEHYFSHGLPAPVKKPVEKVSVIIWDHCRNHFSKPYSVAEALSRRYKVELISFDFFDEGVFGPLKDDNPAFETKYFKGSDFPSFFDAFKAAMDAVTGDIMYVVKPRVPSLGLAMAVNYQRAIPYVLEINDLETVVSSPKAGDVHKEVRFEDVKLKDKALRSPYSDLWSHLLDPFAKRSPVVITHNKGLDTHYNSNTLYMRNLKDERVYSPGHYDRDRIREELGYKKDDRIILFGGLLRKHKGIYELVELVERLGDKRYKLLFVGSRPTPDQAKLVGKYKDTITVLPPQDRVGMARINYAADLVILWLNPDVPASHYQFPYKATDAFAMQTPVIANDISDLGDLGRQGYLKLVPFGDWNGMVAQIQQLFADAKATARMTDAARRLYLRQFSFNAALGSFELAAQRAKAVSDKPFTCSKDFVKWFNLFYHAASGNSDTFIQPLQQRNLQLLNNQSGQSVAGFGELEDDDSIFIIDVCTLKYGLKASDKKVAVLVFSDSAQQGIESARLFVRRANHPVDVYILVGQPDQRAESIEQFTKNTAYSYLMLADQNAFPCRDWLQFGYEKLTKNNDSLIKAATGGLSSDKLHYVFARAAVLRSVLDGSSPEEVTDERFLVADLNQASDKNTLQPSAQISLVDVKDLDSEQPLFKRDICVVMPCINQALGLQTANLLQQKAGIAADFVVARDTRYQGFITTLNQTARVSLAKYIVYLAEDAIPGDNWLKLAYDRLENENKSVLAFNCGKWHGRVAAFGMVRKDWIYQYYGDSILFEGYKSHRADNEITVIGRATNQFVYAPESILFEDDKRKDFKKKESEAANFSFEDKKLFKERFLNGFSGKIECSLYEELYDEYLEQRKFRDACIEFKIQ